MNTAQMIEAAEKSWDGKGYMSSAVCDTAAGRVACFIDHSKENAKGFGKHISSRFCLDGKVISRANLEKRLNK